MPEGPERVQIGALVELPRAQGLGCDVGRGSGDVRRRAKAGHRAEVDQLDDALWRSPHIACADIAMKQMPGVRIIGTARHKAAVLSFVVDGVHPHDVGTLLNEEGVAIRTGHHCAQPVMDRFGVPATTRASLAFYNTTAEIDALVAGLNTVKEIFS